MKKTRRASVAGLCFAFLLGAACSPDERTFGAGPGGGEGGSGTGGGAGQGGAGTGGACSSPADCPGIENGSATCVGGQCGVVCDAGYVDCDSTAPGCETPSTTSANCGACGNACATGCAAPKDGQPFCNDPIEISAGSAHTCVIRKDGSLWCWGSNASGELGVPGPPLQPVPIQIPLPGKAVKVAAGGAYVNPAASHTCVILEDTTVSCWGSGGEGQLGNGSFASKEQPTQVVGLVNISEIAAGGNHTCALKQDGVLYCWGSDESGQLGHGVGQNSLATPKVTLDAVKHIGLGQNHTCAILQDKEALVCWGENFDGELGIGSQADQEIPTLVHVPLSEGVQEVALGDRHTCARRANEIYCFGNDYNGAIGISQFGPVVEPSLVAVPAVKHIEVGRERSAAVYGDMNGLKMWGVPVLGNGDTQLSSTPVEVPVKNIARLALGYDHSCALLMTGEVLCWGENDQGELGTGMDTSTQYKPVQVAFPQ